METRNYAANADAAPPAAPGAPSNGYPRAADPGAGLEATTPGPHWFYKIGEALRKIITDVDAVPDDADLTLLAKCVKRHKDATTLIVYKQIVDNGIPILEEL